MQDLLILAPQDYGLSLLIGRIRDAGYVVLEHDESATIQTDDRRLRLGEDEFAREFYEPGELDPVRAVIGEPRVFVISGGPMGALLDAAAACVDARMFVDNDHGIILPGLIFLKDPSQADPYR